MTPFIISALNQDGSVLMVDTVDIDAVTGAQAYSGGSVVATLDAVESTDPYVNGARYREDGALRLYDATSALPAGVMYIGGMTFSATGQLCVTTDAVVDAMYISGVAVRQDGAVYVDFGHPIITAAEVSDVTGTEITFDATTSGDISDGIFFVNFNFGASADPSAGWQEYVAGAVENQSITIDIAAYGGTVSSIVVAQVGYNPLAPGDSGYSAANDVLFGGLIVPVVVSAAIDNTSPAVGDTLTGSHGIIVGGSPMTITQQWQLCDGAGANCVAIPGETATTYEVVSGDVGDTLKFQQTSTNSAGSDTATSAATAAVVSAGSLEIVGTAGSVGGNSTTKSVTGFTTTAPGRIFAFIRLNSGVVTGVTDNAGTDIGAWSFVGKATNTSGVEAWTAVSTAALSSVQVDVTFSVAPGYSTVTLCCVKDAESGVSYLDGSIVTDTTKPADPSAITTTVADTIIFGSFYMDSVVNPTAATGWTNINPGANSYLATLYQIVSAIGTYNPTLSTGAADSGRSITFAVKKA